MVPARPRRQVGLPAALVLPMALRLAGFVIGDTPVAAFLNYYRVEEARMLLGDQDQTDKPITVALDSGSASLVSFNPVFRAVGGGAPPATDAVRAEVATRFQQMPGFEERDACI